MTTGLHYTSELRKRMGGSLVAIDADRRITFAYVMNQMAAGAIAAALGERVSEIVNR